MRGLLTVATLGIAAMLLTACNDAGSNSFDDVTFTDSNGERASVTDFAGQPLVINMWATNCAPCVKEMPAFDQVASELSGGVQIIGVNVFDTPANAAAFAADLGVTYPQFTDPDGALSSALSVTGLPATGFFDADGNLLDVHQGAFTADELRSTIAEFFPAADGGANP